MTLRPDPGSSPDGVVPEVRRIAVLRANALGDFVLALPALDALRAAYPSAEISFLGVGWHVDLLAGRPGPWDRVVVVPPYPGVSAVADSRPPAQRLRAFFGEQRSRRYDLAVQLHGGGGHSNPFVTSLGARVTAGSRDWDAPPLDRWLPYEYYQPEVFRYLEVVALVGAPPVTIEPRLRVTAADQAAAEAVTASVPPPEASPWVAIHPGATDPRRRWPPEDFAAVARALVAEGARVVVIGRGPDEDRAAEAIVAATPPGRTHNLVDALSLPAMVGLLSRCRLMLGNDSGPRHLAAAVGTATVGVFWCGNVITAAPSSRARHRVAISFRTACPDCGQQQVSTRCPHNSSFVADVPTAEVRRRALALYHGQERS